MNKKTLNGSLCFILVAVILFLFLHMRTTVLRVNGSPSRFTSATSASVPSQVTSPSAIDSVASELMPNGSGSTTGTVSLPPSDGHIWKTNEYEIIGGTAHGVLGIQHKNLRIFSALPDLSAIPCARNGTDFCTLLPNGQKIVLKQELILKLQPSDIE